MAYPNGHVETFVLTVGATPVNVATGTTAAPTTTDQVRQHKGVFMTFQCQHASAKVKIGGADVATNGGIQLQTNFGIPTQIGPGSGSMSCLNAAEWWVVSDTAGSTVVVQLVHSI